ncbi:DUF4262 domain-containing protein [uncultured Jatrophihabitans sp.]|uniref:DUF4262 domain-containing protein n=1 Tax=uncultured Jatrophihabitans sp. TaxID=1610747 RepID=UPI0035CBADBC
MCDCCDFIAARGGRPDDPRLVNEYQRVWRAGTKAKIREHGRSLVYVETRPTLTYTIGLWSAGHAELAVFGLEPHVAGPLLNTIGDQLSARRETLGAGSLLVESGWELKAFQLPRPYEVAPQIDHFYRRRPQQTVPVLQLVYPDVHGVWPWEPGCHQFPGQQPMPGTWVA